MNNYAFIDSQNVHLSTRDQGWSLDWKRFRKYLKDKYCVMKAFIFIGYLPGNERLYAMLEDAGYIIIFKPTLQIRAGDRTLIKGNVDAELVLHAMIEWSNYDQAVIVTGDGDFFCLIRHLLIHQKLLYILIPNQDKYSSLLRGFGSHILFMNVLKEMFSK